MQPLSEYGAAHISGTADTFSLSEMFNLPSS